jgi:hypothetical protein
LPTPSLILQALSHFFTMEIESVINSLIKTSKSSTFLLLVGAFLVVLLLLSSAQNLRLPAASARANLAEENVD